MSTVAIGPVLRSELRRWRGSAVSRLPWAAPAYGAVSALLFLGSATDRDWPALLAYQNLWVTFLGPMLLALLVGTQARIEKRAAGGGTWFRPVPARTARIARFAGLALRSLQLNVLVLVPVLVVGVAVAGTPPGDLVAVGLVPWAAQLALVAVLLRVGEIAGRTAVLGAGLLWSVAAVLLAESSAWPVLPVAWTVRGSLPVIGTHANGVGLSPTDPLAASSPWGPTLLAVAFAVVVVLLPNGPRRRGRGAAGGRRAAGPPVPATRAADAAATAAPARRDRPRVTRAMLVVLARTPIPWLAAGAVACGAVFLRWRSPEDSVVVLTLVVVPVGSVVLAATLWRAMAPGWQGAAVRASGPARPAVVSAGLGTGVAVTVVVVTTMVYLAAGMSIGRAAVLALTASVTAAMLTVVHLWLAVRTSTAVTVAVGIAGCVVGMLVGGTSMQSVWWLAVPWSWAHYLDADRSIVIVPVALVLTAAAAVLLAGAGRSAAARS